MNAHFPPFDKSPGTVSARSLYDETQVIAERQDRDNDALPSILAAMREVVARLERYAERKAPPRVANTLHKSAITAAPQHPMAAEWVRANSSVITEEPYNSPSAEGLDTRIIKSHPMAAESIREQDERLAWMEARL